MTAITKQPGQNGQASTNGNQPAPQTGQAQNGVQKFNEGTVENVLARIATFQTSGGLKLPPDYSAENAVRSAWLVLQEIKNTNNQPALTVCTPASIANAMLNMVLQGLNPVKKQCYFIVRGNQLCMDRSYIGTIAIAKRVAKVQDANANVVYQGDEFEYEINTVTGKKKVTKHIQKLENIDINKITGAYVTVVPIEGETFSEIMTMAQIRQAWNQGPMKGQSPAHKNFPDQMAMKTVTSRGLKIAIGASDDSGLYDDEDDVITDAVAADVKQEIKDHGNKEPIGFSEEAPEGSQEEQPELNAETVDTNTGEVKEEKEEPENNQANNQPAGKQIIAPFA
jgi:recombination protein RecT